MTNSILTQRRESFARFKTHSDALLISLNQELERLEANTRANSPYSTSRDARATGSHVANDFTGETQNAPLWKSQARPGSTADRHLAYQSEARDQLGQWTQGGSAARTRPREVPQGVPLPRSGFIGARGHSLWRPPTDSDAAQIIADVSQSSGGQIGGVQFRRGFPVFRPFVAKIGGIRARVQVDFTGDRDADFRAADRALALRLGWMKRGGKPDAARVKRYRQQKRLTYHHHEDCSNQRLELVPTELHSACPHAGGHSICA